MVEKLSKALEGLKHIQFTSSTDDTNLSKREKMFFCVLAADVMVSMKAKNTQNLSVIVENMINLCDDNDSNVRMVADESLNRIIMSLSQSNMLKVQVELHNVIKKNGSPRCLRAALIRFGQLSHYIRPNKGKAHVQMLIPALIEIIKREEESIHETVASSLENIFKVLGVFVKDNVLKGLIKAFLHNLSSGNPVIRRCSASSIITVVQYCRKPLIFNCYVLNSLLDCIVPICEENSSDLILGVLGCLRLLVPTLVCVRNEEGISGSFGLRKKQDESILSVDRLIQAFEVCLHYTKSEDHNLVAAALETLNQILQNPPNQLESFFLSPSGFSRSYVHSTKENKLWSRSGSEMSVAFSLPATDEALLLDDSDITPEFSNFSGGESLELKQTSTELQDKNGESEDDAKIVENPFKEQPSGKFGASQGLDIDSETDSLAVSDSIIPVHFSVRIETEDKGMEDTEVTYSRSNDQDDLYSSQEGDRMNCLTHAIDVGSFTDAAVPLIYCARHLAALFLLEGTPNCLKSDKTVRVSIKSLALSCLSAIIKLYPVIMKMNLTKAKTNNEMQDMSDILLFSDHSDPQIRGNICVLVGSFINSALVESKNFNSDWLNDETSKLNSSNLIKIIFKGLQEKSTVCTRQALNAVKLFINRALFSVYNTKFLPVLEFLPALTINSYWLVKVKLVEVLSNLSYVCLSDLTKSNKYQEEVIDSVFMVLLGDEDARVRLAAAEALVRIIPDLWSGKPVVLEYGKALMEPLNRWLNEKNDCTFCSPPIPFSEVFTYAKGEVWNENIEHALSHIVAKLTFSLLVPKTKYFLFGYLEALKLLSQKYPTNVYSKGWNCEKLEVEKEGCYMTSNLITVVMSLILTSPFGLDLAAFSNATALLGNLFAGHSIFHLKTNHEMSVGCVTEGSTKFWKVFKCEKISWLAEEILTHLLKVLNFYSYLIEEGNLSSISEPSTAGTTFLPSLSPIKKQEKKAEEKTDDKKNKSCNNYKQSMQYAKLQQLLKNAYTNYKVSLDLSVGDKFLDLLESTLNALSVILEVATAQETGRFVEEVLSYLRSVIAFRPRLSVICFIRLLKALFGTNLASTWEKRKFSSLSLQDSTLFSNFFHFPSELFSDKIRRRVNSSTWNCENLTACGRRFKRKIVIKNADKTWLATYIRLFEPMIVKSLQLYTITGDVELQSEILGLLNQMVQLRVNYCMLDGKQVFLDFVLKQFELIEHGQIPNVEELLPQIFKFLILLSHEKQHSKPIMSVPKILQLCDGLMASDQPVHTHCIPALIPVVEDIFLFRNLETSAEEKELETQREVLFSMLLRLIEFPKVMDMLSLVLNESKAVEEKERWKRWSRQVLDILLPLLKQDRLRTETFEGQIAFAKLMSSLSPTVLRPINPLLKALFVEPGDYNCQTSLKRWLSKITVLLETVLIVKEETLLKRLEETSLNVNLTTFLPSGNLTLTDPLNIKAFFQTFEPSETVARFLFKVVSTIASNVYYSSLLNVHLQQKLSMFFICIYHILKSGAFHRITNSLQVLLIKEQKSLANVCRLFRKLSNFCPLLTCQFSYFLVLLNYSDQSYWTEILAKPSTLSGQLIQISGVISLSDYLCENLRDAETLHFLLKSGMEELIVFSQEIPVKELLLTMFRKPSVWALLLDTISEQDFESRSPHFVEKLLRLLELTENQHSGPLLKLFVEKFLKSPRLALSLLASSIACRQVEYLLTLPMEKILTQIDCQTFQNLVDVFQKEKYIKRYSTLWGLLNKLRNQVFKSSLLHLNENKQAEELKSDNLGEDWYFAQIKQRCCNKGGNIDEIPLLLTKLRFERISEIMSYSDFNVKILKNCLSYQQTLRKMHQMQDNEDQSHSSGKDLYEAAKQLLLSKITEIRKESQEARRDSEGEIDPFSFVKKLRSSDGFDEKFWEIATCLTVFLELSYYSHLEALSEWAEGITECMILCFTVLEVDVRQEKVRPRSLEIGLKCCTAVLRSRQVNKVQLTRDNLESCINSLFCLVTHLVPSCQVSRILKGKDLATIDRSEELEFLLEFAVSQSSEGYLPDYLWVSIRDLVVNICRAPALNSDALKVPEDCDMQDIELLKSFISRFSVIGWSGRQQFEEIWVGLLSVLGFNSQGDVPLEDNDFIVQASAVAVEGITTLLKNTMMDSRSRRLIHHGRDSLSMKSIYEKLPIIHNLHRRDEFGERSFQFLDNLEILQRDERYFHGLLSVEYLWTAVKQISSGVDLYERHCEELKEFGLDLPSCIHLLTELYNQWIYQASPDIKILTSSLKSSIVMSDLFTEIAQFQWLLNFCLRVDEIIIPEDTVLLPLVIFGCCKAGAIVLPNEEVCGKIKKIMLRSKSLPCKISAVEGLLYLLQSYVVCYGINHTTLPPPGLTFKVDEANFVANIVDTFLPVAIDAAQEFTHKQVPLTEEYERCHWALIFYLLQHYQPSLGDLKQDLFNFIISTLCLNNCSDSVLALLTRGIQRLLLTTVIDENFREQLSKVSLEIVSNNSLAVARNGLQLLSVLSFLDKRVKDIRQLVTGQEDPERVMRDMEKINVLFEKLKKSYPKEAEVIESVISYVLMDFTASDVLTKVIQEFLSSHQPHQQILAGLLFKVFERAEKSLLEDWVVFSLPGFIQGLPISMSIWTLNCFFVSASREPWLRSLFPLVQSRIRMAEVEDRKLLCLSGSLFFKQLKQENQRKSFVQTFKKATAIDGVFFDLLTAIS